MENLTFNTTNTLELADYGKLSSVGHTPFFSSLFVSLLTSPSSTVVDLLYSPKYFRIYRVSTAAETTLLASIPVSNAYPVSSNDNYTAEFVGKFYGVDYILPQAQDGDTFWIALSIRDDDISLIALDTDLYSQLQSQQKRIALIWTIQLSTQSITRGVQ